MNFYPFIIVITLVVLVTIVVSELRKKKESKILLAFQNHNLEKLEIYFSQMSYDGFKQFGGISTKANLYFEEKMGILIFTTNKNRIWSVWNNNLPLIVTNKEIKELQSICYPKKVNKIITKSDEYILIINDTASPNKRIEFNLYSEKENLKLKNITAEFEKLNLN